MFYTLAPLSLVLGWYLQRKTDPKTDPKSCSKSLVLLAHSCPTPTPCSPNESPHILPQLLLACTGERNPLPSLFSRKK